ncbi:MAG: hypothetical protein ABTQ26_09760 [Azonexus sp.]
MPQTADRRARDDQRLVDRGPPSGCCERRRRAERRLPSIEESTISDAEWESLFGSHLRDQTASNPLLDHAAEIFDRAKNSH